MRKGFYVVLLAAGLAGCGAGAQEYRNDKERAFGESFTWEWRGKDPSASAVPAKPGAGGQGDLDPERREFEDWRAWQEWKRRNPK